MNIFRTFLIAGSLIFSVSSNAQILDQNLRITLETPISKQQYAQIGSVRGWAFHPTQVVDVVEIYIDGNFFSEVPVGGQRTDVYNAYPNAVNSEYSGWAQTLNFKSLSAGYHTLEVRAFTTTGRYNSVTSEFCVDKFTGEFITDPSIIDFRTLELIHMAKNALLLQKIEVDGEYYNMELHWDNASQGFVIEQIRPHEEIIDGDYSAYCTICKPNI